MKNLILFSILVLLLVFTYFFEEKGYIAKSQKQEKMKQIFDKETLGELVEFQTTSSNVYKVDNSFFVGKPPYPVDKVALKSFFKILSNIKVRSFIESNIEAESLFLGKQSIQIHFVFRNGKLKFTLGEKLKFENSFYMQIEKDGIKTTVIAYDSSGLAEMHDNKKVRTNNKYNRLKNIFNMRPSFFEDKRIIKDLESNDLGGTIAIENVRNKSFSIDLTKFLTRPLAYNEVPYKKEKFLSYLENLAKMRALEIYSKNSKMELKNKISSLSINFKKTYKLNLYRKYGKMSGYFLKLNDDSFIYEINSNVNRLFFVNVQDFWDKRIVDNCQKEFKENVVLGKSKGRSIKVLIDSNSTQLIAKAPKLKAKNSAFKQLLDFICNKEAEYVINNNGVIKGGLYLGFLGRELYIVYKNGEIIIQDLERQLQYHYFIGDEKIVPINVKEYFLK